MKVKTEHGTFDVPNISFKSRRDLHKLEVGAVSKKGEIDTSKFFIVLDWILNYSFTDPEKDLGKLDDNSIDEVLMAIYNAYKEPNKKK
tara:strand:- start:13735 stop:13998 length:264 start_codon:yes stop_codon:yes gene_type:complete